MDTTQKSNEDSANNDKSLLADSFMLRNLDDGEDLNNEDGMPSDEEDDNEDDPELLADLDTKQEDLIEEFMGRTFDLKTERVEELRTQCKADGLTRDEIKVKVSETEKQVVSLRR